MEAGATIKENISARINNTSNTIKGVTSTFRNAIGDVVERFDLDQQTEPSWGKQYRPGKAGEVGDLKETAIAIPLALSNVFTKHVQTFAKINRSWVK